MILKKFTILSKLTREAQVHENTSVYYQINGLRIFNMKLLMSKVTIVWEELSVQ